MRYLSLFSGIEAATAAWHHLGWECAGVAEIEPFPRQLLKQHYPNVPNLGDVTKVTAAAIAALGHLDLIVFGSPCQDLSVAGKRKGLDGARSGLFFTALQIIRYARTHCGLRWALWENVPGAFTSNGGADFAAVVAALAGLDDVPVPPKKWGNEGAAIGPEAMVEWSTLDARWFGVAQRRRRVFALADFGDWAGRPPVLLEPEGLRGDSAPRREAGEDIAGTLTRRPASSGGLGTDFDLDGGLVAERGRSGDVGSTGSCDGAGERDGRRAGPVRLSDHEVVATLDASFARLQGCSGQDLNHGHSHLLAFGGNNTSGPIDVSTALNASGTASGRMDFESETFLVAPPVAFMPARTLAADGGIDERFAERDVCDALHGSSGGGNKAPLIAFDSRQDPVSSREVFGALGSSSPQAQAIAFQSSQSGVRLDTVHATLDSNNGPRRHNGALVPSYSTKLHNTSSNQAGKLYEEYTVGLDASSPPPALLTPYQVRRLTPRECERLQAFPDDYTAVEMRGKPAADGPRYKALGNSMCVNVMRWIGTRIDFVHTFFGETEEEDLFA